MPTQDEHISVGYTYAEATAIVERLPTLSADLQAADGAEKAAERECKEMENEVETIRLAMKESNERTIALTTALRDQDISVKTEGAKNPAANYRELASQRRDLRDELELQHDIHAYLYEVLEPEARLKWQGKTVTWGEHQLEVTTLATSVSEGLTIQSMLGAYEGEGQLAPVLGLRTLALQKDRQHAQYKLDSAKHQLRDMEAEYSKLTTARVSVGPVARPRYA